MLSLPPAFSGLINPTAPPLQMRTHMRGLDLQFYAGLARLEGSACGT